MRIVAWLVLIIGIVRDSKGQDDSLRSAVEALGQRQRELDYDDNYEYGYTLERPEDLVFLNPSGYGREHTYERPVNLNYLDDDKFDMEMSKRISSAFRERVEEDNQRQQLEEMAENLINNMENRGSYNVENEDYDEIIKELWDKYRRPSKVYATTVNKRFMVPRFGLDGAGLRKRIPYGSPGGEYYDDTYGSKDDIYDDDDDDYQYLKKRYQNKFSKVRQMFSNPYSGAKRFPVTKRSSDNKELHEHKRSSIKKQTDPKVEKELSNIFGTSKTEETTTKKPNVTKPLSTTKIEGIITKSPKDVNSDKKIMSVNKEQMTPISPAPSEKPLQIKKKSIDWSDYFGLDRRKKSEPEDLDKEWLINRYHKSIRISNKKRNDALSLSSFRNHEEPRKKSSRNESDKSLTDEQKINEMDSKLQAMEDKIVDDALKFTGAHEGESDPKEVQEIKDKVISRLAAAYSLEKMRTALGEYRLAVAKEKERLKNRRPTSDDDNLFSEEKRTAIPRKYVIDKERDSNLDGDNNIKCADGDEDCHEQNYKTPNEIIESHFGTEVCPAIVKVCNDGAIVAGEYASVFRSACQMHEMCLICSNNSWFSPTRQCHSLFVAKAFDLCKGDPECQKVAQRSVRYLINVTRSLHAEDPSGINDCEMSCPEPDANLYQDKFSV